MKKQIEYKNGSVLGDYGVVYLYELDPRVQPSGKIKRKAKFECGFCGNVFDAHIYSVASGHTKSCGCYKINMIKKLNASHNLSNKQLYAIWKGIKARCYNKNVKSYKRYGGRGITMCDEWKNNPKAFYDYMTQLPYYGESGKSIDRHPDNDGNYEPGNVRWATAHEQCANQSVSSKSKSGYIGVNFNEETNKWRAVIMYNEKNIHIGYFFTPKEAAIARDQYIIDNELWEYPLQVLEKP